MTKVYISYRNNEVIVAAPFDSILVQLLRELDIRRFKGDTKEWVIGLAEAQYFINKAREKGFEVEVDAKAKTLNLF